jgi:uncharacterized protein (DUF433 family)
MNWRDHITADNSVLLGKPTITGTRISVEFLLKLLAAGWTEDQILANYPRLKKEDMQAVFAYIHECIQDGLMYDLPDQTAS